MSKSWLQPLPRRAPGSFHASRSLRRAAPYPSKEDREDYKNALDRYEELEKSQSYPAVNYERFPVKEQVKVPMPTNKSDGVSSERRKSLYQKFYKRVQEEWKPSNCVVLSVANRSPDYSKSLGKSLQERGLSVEMLFLHAESGLTRALQDIRADGSPLCILVEQTNITLCSCTVIIFAQSLKIHRNMPKDQALDFVVTEYRQNLAELCPSKDPADIAAETSEMLDDYLGREKREIRHYVPSDVRRLLVFLAEGVHLNPEELDTLSEYVLARQEQAGTFTDNGNSVSTKLGKPPPLLPTPSSSQSHSTRSSSLSKTGSVLRSPPPLMSKSTLLPPPSHIDMGRGPLLDTPRFPRGPLRRLGPCPMGGPRPALLIRPGGPLLPRPRGPLL